MGCRLYCDIPMSPRPRRLGFHGCKSALFKVQYRCHGHGHCQLRHRLCNLSLANTHALGFAASEEQKDPHHYHLLSRSLVSRIFALLCSLSIPNLSNKMSSLIIECFASVCAVSIYRITVISRLSLVDGPWADVDPAIWSIVEVSVGILCACLPTLRPLANNVLKGSTRLLSLSRSWTSSTGERGSGSSSEEKSLSLSRDSGGSQQQQEQDFPRHRQQQHGPSLYECYDPTKTRNRSMDTPPSSAFHSSSYPSRPPPSTQIRPRTETQGFSAMSKYNQHSPVYPYYTSHTNSTSTAAAASSHHSSSYRPQPPPKSHPTTTTASKSRPEIYIQSDVDVSSSSPSPHRPA